jgi:hypothetical protein
MVKKMTEPEYYETCSVAEWHQLTPEERTALIDKEIALCEKAMAEQQCECDPLDHGLDCPLRMTEHVCEWMWADDRFVPYFCKVDGCDKEMSIEEAEARLNATQRLSAEIVLQNIIIYGEGGFVTDQFLDACKAYADLLGFNEAQVRLNEYETLSAEDVRKVILSDDDWVKLQTYADLLERK